MLYRGKSSRAATQFVITSSLGGLVGRAGKWSQTLTVSSGVICPGLIPWCRVSVKFPLGRGLIGADATDLHVRNDHNL